MARVRRQPSGSVEGRPQVEPGIPPQDGCSDLANQPTSTFELFAQQREFHRIHDDVQILEFVDQRHATLLQWIVNHRIAGCTGQKHDAMLQVRGDGDEGIVEIEPVDLRHEKITDDGGDVPVRGDSVERISSRFCLANVEPPLLENLANCSADSAFIIDHKYCLHDHQA